MRTIGSAGAVPRLGQLSLFNTDPFHGTIPSPASDAAAQGNAWKPTEDALHMPDLKGRLVAGGIVAAILVALTVVSPTA